MQRSFTVSGNYGTITVDAATGDVLAYVPEESEPPAYGDITRFDVAEWRTAYPGETLAGMSVDILDLAFWHAVPLGFWADGPVSYQPAESDWRAQFRADRGPRDTGQVAEALDFINRKSRD